MKVYTITCHDVYNAGASLQAYALMKYLTALGHDVEIIDYKPEYLSRHYKLGIVCNPIYEKNIFLKYGYLIAKFPGRLKNYYSKKKKLFDEFKGNYLKCTNRRYISNDDLKTNLPIRDIYIAGSDQIWNTFFQNGKDPAFYLDFAPKNSIKASYAASFATDDIIDIDKSIIKKRIENLNYIAVREKSGINILESLGINTGTVVMDPVFLLNKEEWIKLSQDSKLNLGDKYLFIYDFDNNQLIKEKSIQLAKEKGWKIYSLFNCDYADKCFDNFGPLDFLKLVYNAEFIVSNSFHATAFSVIFNKQFEVINRKEGINTRMRDFLDTLEIDNNNVKNYNVINKKLEFEIKKSKLYISSIFEVNNYEQ